MFKSTSLKIWPFQIVFFTFCFLILNISFVFAHNVTENIKKIDLDEAIDVLEMEPSRIPIQIPITDERYDIFRKKVSTIVGKNTSDCALFVNRMFLYRFGKMMFGNAWSIPIKKENQAYLDLVWKLDESQYIREENLRLHNVEDRVAHFEELYDVLDKEERPLGTIGFLYHYSFYRSLVAAHKEWLPQTHITFLAGKKKFYIENKTDIEQTIEKILVKKFGIIHDFERDFVNKKVPLNKKMKPGEKYAYEDYLIEEHAKIVRHGSLLELFLTKHRNNHITPLFRPVSYSRVSKEILKNIEYQEKIMADLGSVEYITGVEFAERDFAGKEEWKKVLKKYFDMDYPEKNLVVVIPKMATEVSVDQMVRGE